MMIRLICFTLVMFMSTTGYAQNFSSEKLFSNEKLLETPLKISLIIQNSRVSVSTISPKFQLSGEGKEEESKITDGKVEEHSQIGWELKVDGYIVHDRESGLYTIQLKGNCEYYEQLSRVEAESGNQEDSEIHVELTFVAGTRVKLGQEKVIASQNNNKLRILIELDE